jgi:Ras-related C3 botulinum toxin substrate 1
MGDRSELAEWASNVNWADFIDDDEVYATLSKLKVSIDQFDDDNGDDGDIRIKLVAVGDGAVGKTSLLIAYAKGTFPDTYIPTVFENYTAPIDHNGKKVLLHLWDTAGQEDYDRLRPLSYPGADIVLLCFSLVTEASFESVRDKWHPEVDHYIKNVPTILVGTKVDLREAKLPDPSTGEFHPVSNDQAEKMADEIGSEKYMALSAKTGENLKNLFHEAVSIVLAARKVQSGVDSPKKESEKKSDKGEDDQPTLKVVKRQQKDQNKKGKCTLL